MKAVAVLIAVASMPAVADSRPLEWQLPTWAQKQWAALSESKMLDLSRRLEPFMYVGDFDGDDTKDVAVLVKRRTDGKEGMVVLWQSGAPSTVLGAGNTFGNGGDDFSWLDLWGIEFNGSLQESYYEAPVRLEADALVVAKEGSASALIYFVKGEPKWQQLGD